MQTHSHTCTQTDHIRPQVWSVSTQADTQTYAHTPTCAHTHTHTHTHTHIHTHTLTAECCPGVSTLSQLSHLRQLACQSLPKITLRSAVCVCVCVCVRVCVFDNIHCSPLPGNQILISKYLARRGVVVSGGWSNGSGWQQTTK